MDDPINIPLTQPEDVLPDLATIRPTVPQLSPELMDGLAAHYNNGLGEQSPGAVLIRGQLVNNREPELRRDLAITEQSRLAQRRAEIAQRYLASRPAGQPVNPDELQAIYRLSAGELDEGDANPRTIIERITARNTNAVVANQGSVTRADTGQETATMIDAAGQRHQWLQEYAANRLHELAARAAAMGHAEYSAEMIGLMASPLQWYRQIAAGTSASIPTTSYLLGTNVQQQGEWYYSHGQQNLQEATDALDRAVTELTGTNVLNAIQYLSQIVGMSSWDVGMQNISAFRTSLQA